MLLLAIFGLWFYSSGGQFEPEVILLAVGWYLRFSLSYRDVEELLAEREFARRPRPRCVAMGFSGYAPRIAAVLTPAT